MKIIAHRAGTDRFPEQSLKAIEHSLKLGADYAEVDVRFTKDNVPVVCHDPNTKRIFGVNAKIKDLDLKEFLDLKHVADSSMSTFTLEELFQKKLFPLLLHIKIVESSEIEAILGLIKKYDVQQKIILGMESTEAVEQVKVFDEEIVVLAFMPNRKDINEFLSTRADIIRLWEKWVNIEAIEKIHSSGKQCWVMVGGFGNVGYTDIKNIPIWKDMGVDGILINELEPLKAKGILK